jgi:hypothetical protein
MRPALERIEQVLAPHLQLVTLDHLRARGAAAPHRDDAGVEPLPRQQPRQIPRYRRLADPLAGPDDRERRLGGHLAELRRPQLEVAPQVARSGGERQRSYPHPLPVADDGLVGEVHDYVDGVLGEGILDRGCRVLAGYEGHTVVGPLFELLRAAQEGGGYALGA